MGQLSATYPDETEERVLEAVADYYNYTETKFNNETKKEFAERQFKDQIQTMVITYEAEQAAVTARASQAQQTSQDIPIT